jgi:hypothetical protein
MIYFSFVKLAEMDYKIMFNRYKTDNGINKMCKCKEQLDFNTPVNNPCVTISFSSSIFNYSFIFNLNTFSQTSKLENK